MSPLTTHLERTSLSGQYSGIVGSTNTAVVLKFPHSLRIQDRHEYGLGPYFLLRWVAKSRCLDHLFWVIWVITCPSGINVMWKQPCLTDSHFMRMHLSVHSGVHFFARSIKPVRRARKTRTTQKTATTKKAWNVCLSKTLGCSPL